MLLILTFAARASAPEFKNRRYGFLLAAVPLVGRYEHEWNVGMTCAPCSGKDTFHLVQPRYVART